MIMKNFKNEKIQEANRYIKELVYQSAHLENKEICSKLEKKLIEKINCK